MKKKIVVAVSRFTELRKCCLSEMMENFVCRHHSMNPSDHKLNGMAKQKNIKKDEPRR